MKFPLEGLRILDLSFVFSGPFATRILADMGAEVIKIESAVRSGRGGTNPQPDAIYPDNDPGERPYNRSAFYNELNRNKFAITLDLSKKEGKEVFKKLVKISDVVLENFSPRVMKNFGLDYSVLREINPKLIMVSISGYGATGPYRNYVSYGPGIEAMTGLSQLTGYKDGPPMRLGVALADAVAGFHAAYATLLALRWRRLTGEGQHIDISLREPLTCFLAEAILDYTMNGRKGGQMGNCHPRFLQGCYRCKGEDNWVAISVTSDEEWKGLCQAFGNPFWTEKEKFAEMESRLENQDEIDELIEDWTGRYEAYEAMHILQKNGVRAGAVLKVSEMLKDPHFRERGFFESVSHPEAGTHLQPGMPWKFSRTSGKIRRPAPCFGEHNEYIFKELLGMSDEEIAKLKWEGIVSEEPKL